MSVATEFPPEVYIPAAARPRSLRAVPGELDDVIGPAAPAAALGAGVVDLDRWRHQFVGAQAGGRRRNASGLRIRPELRLAGAASAGFAAAPIRLTRRGVVVLAAVSIAVAAATIVLAWLSAAGSGAAAESSSAAGASVVTVHAGDSLWSIAVAVAPNRDPRAEIAQLRAANHLPSDVVTPGQQLRVR